MAPDDISRHKYALREKQQELRSLLLAWDPIGVGPNGPSDEYDCLLRVIGMLRNGMTAVEFGRFLDTELERHFGLSTPSGASAEFARRVHDWYWKEPLPGSQVTTP